MYNMTTTQELFGDVIHAYTREMALEDGYLVDITEAAGEVGIKYPVAITHAAWEDCVEWEDTDNARKKYNTCQDERGRLHDVVWMLYLAIRAIRNRGQISTCFNYDLYRVPSEGRGFKARRTTLKAVCGPGDNAEPVITIMLPNED